LPVVEERNEETKVVELLAGRMSRGAMRDSFCNQSAKWQFWLAILVGNIQHAKH
jgi:hypothetical protein